MADFRLRDIDIHDAEVERLLYSPAGPVVRLVAETTARVHALARTDAPVRSGELRRSVSSSVEIERGRGRVRGEIIFDVDHGIWVEKGTSGPITPKRGRYLRFPESRRGFPFQVYRKSSVRGQAAQHVLQNALHRGVRGTGLRWTVHDL